VTTSWSAATGTGSLLVAILTYNGTTTISAPASWAPATSVSNGTNVSTAIYYLENAASQTSVAFTATGTSSAPALSVQLIELLGMVTSGSLDITATNTASAASSLTVTPSGNTVNPQDVAIISFASDNNSAAAKWGAVPSGFTALSQLSNTTRSISAYRTVAAAGTKLTETMSIKKTANMAGAVVSFKANVAAWYWRGGASDCVTAGSNWTNAACWAATSGGAANNAMTTPASGDMAVFDGSLTGNCTISSAITVGTIDVKNGYTGTITHSSGNVTTNGSWLFELGTMGAFNSTVTSTSTTIGTLSGGAYIGDLVMAGGSFTLAGAALNLRSLTVSNGTFSSGASAVTTNSGGTVGLSGGSITFGTGQVTFNSDVTVAGGTLTMPTSGTGHTAAGNVDVSGGSMIFGTGTTTFAVSNNFLVEGGTVSQNNATLNIGSAIAYPNDGLTITSGTFDGGTGTLNVTGNSKNSGAETTINGSGAVFTSGTTSQQNFSGILNVTSGSMTLGVAQMNSGRVAGGSNTDMQVIISSGGTLTLSSSFSFPSTLAMTIDGTLNAGSGTVTVTPAVTVSSTGAFNGVASTTTFGSTLAVNGTCSAGAGNLTSTGAVTIGSTGTYNANTGKTTFSSTTALAGTFNANSSSNVTFSNTTALSGTFNANSTTNATFTGVVSMTGTSAFNGNTGKTTFTAAPTLTAGSFTVGDAGSTGSVTFSSGATFTSGMTLAFPTSGGELSLPNTKTLSIDGTVTSSAGSIAALPKVDCSGCVAGNAGITVSFTSNAKLTIDGLNFDHVGGTGVTIASGVTYTTFKDIKFTNSGSGATSQLTMTLATQIVNAPGCYFDGTATHNVTLNGTSGALRGARAIFENRSAAVNGSGAGNANDADGDKGSATSPDVTANDNYVDPGTPGTPYYGSVVEWVYASPTDTAGTAVAFPTAAFDWNTFSYYGVYVAYKNASGSNSVLWMRNSDGSPAYSFTVDHTTCGDLIGTPYWDTINETTTGVDANGDGLLNNTDVRVVYLATTGGTTGGHIIKLVDSGSGLARPGASSPWNTDFTDSTVTLIDSPLADDVTNLYFGGRNGTSPNVYALQIASGTNEKKLVHTVGALSVVTTTPSWTTSSGSTYVFLGSTTTSGGTSYIYRINMTNGTVDASSPFTGMTSFNGAIVIQASHAYASSDAGQIYSLDALNFASGKFINITGYPAPTTAVGAIKFAPWVDSSSNVYFGDNNGKLYQLGSSGSTVMGISLSSQNVTSTPIYRSGAGVIGVGANDGYVYFVDRSAQAIFKRFFVTTTGNAVSSVSYDANNSAFLVSSSDGKLLFINASDVTDPTPATP
jgi:hypothetical protein